MGVDPRVMRRVQEDYLDDTHLMKISEQSLAIALDPAQLEMLADMIAERIKSDG